MRRGNTNSKPFRFGLLPADEVGRGVANKTRLIDFVASLAPDNPLRPPALNMYEKVVDIEHQVDLVTSEMENFSGWRTVLRHPLRSMALLRRVPELLDWAKVVPSESHIGYIGLSALQQVDDDVQRGRNADEVREDLDSALELYRERGDRMIAEAGPALVRVSDSPEYEVLRENLHNLADAAILYAGLD